MATTSAVFFPDAFLSAMRSAIPDTAGFNDFIAACQRPLRRSLRVNTLKISVADFLIRIAPLGWQLTPIPWCPEGFWVESIDENIAPPGSVAEHLCGLFYIQEASSMLPVSALFSRGNAPQRVMDVAAAPGSKTTQIAANMHNRGAILANELSSSRLKALHANLSRCGVANVALTHFDGRVFGAAAPESFDSILLDAPCSGEGVVRKDPNALRNWSVDSNQSIAETQLELIESAFHALCPGGVLIYSTCTLNMLENQQVCRWLIERYPQAIEIESLEDLFPEANKALTPEGFLHIFPHYYDCEGFFVARFRKTASVPPPEPPRYRMGAFPFSPLRERDARLVEQAAKSAGLVWDSALTLWQRDKELWLFPQTITPLLGKIRFSRIGIHLATQHNKGYRWQHEAAIALGDTSAPGTIALSAEQAEEWFRGRDIYPDSPVPEGEALLSYNGAILGIAKKVGTRLKNNYPRELVRDGRLLIQTADE